MTDDEALLSALADALTEVDPVPEASVFAARSAFAYRELDAQLATLLEDSGAGDLAGVRGAGSMRLLLFELGDQELEVGLEVGESGLTVIGSTTAAAATGVVVESAAGSNEGAVEEGGRFRLPAPGPFPLRLRIVMTGAADLVTPWIASA